MRGTDSHRTSKPGNVLGIVFVLLAMWLLVGGKVFAGSGGLVFSNGEAATLVVGQSAFDTRDAGTTQSMLDAPVGLAFDKSGNLWVADDANGRVLEFTTPLSTGEAASIVLGEPDFTTSTECFGSSLINSTCLQNPTDLAFDSSGDLWVSDSSNQRVVEFQPPFSNGMAASLEVGQPDMNTGSNPDETPTQSDLNAPYGLAFDHSGNLWVADTGYNRVLEFPLPFSNGESATLVVGQSNFTSGIYPNEPGCPPQCGTPSAQSLNNPGTVSFDSQGNLWVADTHDDRILEYTGPFSTGMAASLVLGHSDFSTGAGFCTSQSCFQTPFAASFDNSGSLWVADTVNYRMLEFNSPFSSDQNASVVLGQPDFITMAPPSGQINATSSDMNGPQGLAVDKSGDLWVADTGDNRILEFMAGAAPTTSTSSSSSSTSTSSASTTATTATSQASTPTSSTTAVTAGSSTTNTGGGSIPEFPGGGLVFLAFTVAVVGAYLVLRPRDRTPRA